MLSYAVSVDFGDSLVNLLFKTVGRCRGDYSVFGHNPILGLSEHLVELYFELIY